MYINYKTVTGKTLKIVNNNLFFYNVQTRSSDARKTESLAIVLRAGKGVKYRLLDPNETNQHPYFGITARHWAILRRV